MSTSTLTGGERYTGDAALYKGHVALACFFLSEAHMFGALILAFLVYLDDSRRSETPPAEVLGLGYAIPGTLLLLSSSGTVVLAEAALRRGARGLFSLWWLATVVLGLLFLLTTALEWNDLINGHGLTLSRNLFGTTYFSLVGLHATHVTLGVLALLIVLGLAWAGSLPPGHDAGVGLVSWYWHFVDVVWVVVFTVVYVIGRGG